MSLVVGPTRLQLSQLEPSQDSGSIDGEVLSHFGGGEHSLGTQALTEGLEPGGVFHPLHAGGGEGFSCASEEATIIEDCGDLAVGVPLLEEFVDQSDGLVSRSSPITLADRRGHLESLHATAAKSNLDVNRRVSPGQRDILDEQRGHPLTLTV